MTTFSKLAGQVFAQAILAYDDLDDLNAPVPNPYTQPAIEYFLFLKNWIDNVQWHLEDIIRDPDIDPIEALKIKRRIDASNQDRTDLVELIDSYFLDKYSDVQTFAGARVNTESPAWAIDRLSILKLKIHNMRRVAEQTDRSKEFRDVSLQKLEILLEQDQDLSLAIDELLADIEAGNKYMKVYKQMKMYNDPNLNPILRGKRD